MKWNMQSAQKVRIPGGYWGQLARSICFKAHSLFSESTHTLGQKKPHWSPPFTEAADTTVHVGPYIVIITCDSANEQATGVVELMHAQYLWIRSAILLQLLRVGYGLNPLYEQMNCNGISNGKNPDRHKCRNLFLKAQKRAVWLK